MSYRARTTCQIIGGCLIISAIVLLFVPAVNIWPWVLLYLSFGLGLLIGPVTTEAPQTRAQRQSDAAS